MNNNNLLSVLLFITLFSIPVKTQQQLCYNSNYDFEGMNQPMTVRRAWGTTATNVLTFAPCGFISQSCGRDPLRNQCSIKNSECCIACQNWQQTPGIVEGLCIGTNFAGISSSGSDSVQILYDKGDLQNNLVTQTQFIITCDSTVGDTLVFESFYQPAYPPIGPYMFTVNLKSKTLCGGNIVIPLFGHSISLGSILLIILLGFAFPIYLIGGISLNVLKYEKRGLEVIPHFEFWKTSPIFARDGFYFIIEKVKELKEKLTEKGGYTTIK
jgi:hypothetical protein